MGAEFFETVAAGATAAEAFEAAREDALYWHGHQGYSGTIAEKSGFVLVPPPPEGTDLYDYFDTLVNEGKVSDSKWEDGPCFSNGVGTYTFFGWASS